jgi:hypothetical protein
MLLNWQRNRADSQAVKRRKGRTPSDYRRPTYAAPHLELLEDRSLPSVTLMQNFPDINFQDSGGFTPPDTMMAVGPQAVVGAVNTAITLKSKTGAVLAAPEQFSTFFASIFQAGDTFSDPYLLYDDQAQRFYVAVLEIPANEQQTVIDFAVSNSANPTDLSSANWTVFAPITSANEGGTELPDFPKMGFNNDAVFISTNQFSATSFTHNLILAISKASILAGGTLQTFQTNVATNADIQILIPARMHGGPPNSEFFVQKNDEATSTINVVQESDYLTAAPTFTTTTLKVNAYQQSPGVRDLTDQIDDRILSVDWLNNEMVAAGNVGLSDGLNHARWYLISTAGTPSIEQQGDIVSPGLDSSYPSIALTSNGDIAMTFIQSGSVTDTNNFPSMFVTGRSPLDPPNTMQTPVLVIAGKGHLAGGRGGDYSATEFDPSDPTVFWSAQEYAFDNSGNNFDWGTQIASYSISGIFQETHAFHPFRYIVPEAPQPDAGLFTGNITIDNKGAPLPTGQFLVILGPLPDGVTLDPSVPTIATSTGAVGIPLPVQGLPTGRPIRIAVKFRNPNHVAISTFFEGFGISLGLG